MSGIDDVIALSPLQEGLFSLSTLSAERGEDSAGDVYTIPLTIDITGPLNVAALRAACEHILVRHPNLRAIFWDTGVEKPVQIVPTEVTLPWSYHELDDDEAERLVAHEVRRVFDLREGPSLRFTVIALPDADGAARHRLVVTVHHILMDGWSLGVFFAELLQLYSARGEMPLAPVRPYRDYIAWLVAQDQSAMTQRWVTALDQLSGPLMLADTTGSGLDAAQAARPQALHRIVDAERTAALSDWARRHGVTLNTAVQFAWTLLLSRLTDRLDVVYGTVVTGRPHQVPDADRMIGLFLNTIPVPFTLDPTADVAAECQRLQRESSELRDIGYLSLSTVQRAAGHSALFDTMFVFQNAPMDQAGDMTAADGVTFTPAMSQNLTHYPLTVVAHLAGDELIVAIEAIEAQIPVTSEALADLFLGTLDGLPHWSGTDVGHAAIMSERFMSASLAASNTPVLSGRVDLGVFELFARQADSTPDAVALNDGHDVLTYRELHERALRLAALLGEHGVGAEDFVAICLPRSATSIVSILGILAAGAAYVPVDPTLPDARMESILRQTNPAAALVAAGGPRAVISACVSGAAVLDLDDPALRTRLRAGVPARPAKRAPAQAAYAIFTSGSTGEPKGVVNHDAALASYFADHRARVYAPARARLGRPLTIAHAWSLSFDASWQPLVGLLDGHAVHLFDDEAVRDTQCLVEGIAAQQIDMIDTTPSMFRQLAHAGLVDGYSGHADERGPLSVLALGGEAIDVDLWDQLRGLHDVAVHNCYGPTEATVEAVVADVTGADAASTTPTIGRPTAGMTAYVLDSRLRPVPDGVVGELCLAGPQLTRGYLGRPRETAHRFVADPYARALGLRPRRMYRTGDLVRRLPSGALAYLGRADDQVKVRGYRIEIGEIDNALRAAGEVRDAAAVVVRRAGGAGLVGFVVGEPGVVVDPVALRAAVAQRLPSYMIPARLLVLDELPVTSNGKLDASELADRARAALESSSGTTEPATDTERELTEIFAEVFGGAAPRVDDDFFDLGLDSIVAIAVASAARARGLSVSVRMIAAAPTIRDLGAAIDSGLFFDVADLADDDAGEVAALPYVRWMFAQDSYRRLSHTVLVTAPADLTESTLAQTLQAVLDAHGVLRSTVIDTASGPVQSIREVGSVAAADLISVVDVDADRDVEQIRAAIDSGVEQLDPRAGDIVRLTWLRAAAGADLLAITIHHLAVDVVSWSVLIPALAQAYSQIQAGQPPVVAGAVTSYRRWSDGLVELASSPEVLAQEEFWAGQSAGEPTAAEPTTWGSVRVTEVEVGAAVTEAILQTAGQGSSVREVLLTALALTIPAWRRRRGVDVRTGAAVALESHGRTVGDNTQLARMDPSETVGWFTTVYPVRLGTVEVADAGPSAIRDLHAEVVAALAAVPDDGVGYGLLRDVVGVPSLLDAPEPEVEFNYLGRFDLGFASSGDWSIADDPELRELIPSAPEPDFTLRFPLNLVTAIRAGEHGPELVTTWRWSENRYTATEIDDLAELWRQNVAAVSAAVDVTETRSRS
ncbi:amino acid adenylation domain-containing protein [Gordonia sp. TBRC 11910]|uniref:Amino acid adenylation domain-containing protein n=1 Tax=Gordonia asplenii TaxID=2725283 RepID=A0A848L658_9ACTN|nr:non-ribosomal peptide synthetase [Gordonia asplenii]NMO04153.1 amino acid adenylation domain-containing protein [Gordonia asplenii]